MKRLVENEIIGLTQKTCEILLNKKVQISMKDNWNGKKKYSGIIENIGLAVNFPHQPVDVDLIENDGTKSALQILKMSEIIIE